MTGPFRLAASAPACFGTAIDRTEPIGFRVGGRALSGLYGDTLASALMASGVQIHGASPLLGRPRGVMALGMEDSLTRSLEGDPGPFAAIAASELALREGLRANGGDRGVGMALRRFAPPAGSETRTLPAGQLAFERLRRALPLPGPRVPALAPRLETKQETCAVVVIGAGLAGLAAAASLRSAGLDVRVIEASSRAGGAADLYEGRIDGRPLLDWVTAEAGKLKDRGALLLRAIAIDIAPDGTVTAIERPDPQRPGRVTLRLISANAVVVATGYRERPLIFADNDRPGVILAQSARALLRRHAVAPGARALVATTCDEGYRAAMDLREAGVTVDLVLDARGDPGGPTVAMAKTLGAPLSLSTVVTGVEYDPRKGGLVGVRTRNRYGEGAAAGVRVLPANALVVSGGFVPRDELVRPAGLGVDQGVHVAFRGSNAVDAVGGGWAAGAAAAAELGAHPSGAEPSVEASADEAGEAQGLDPASFRGVGAAASFVDFGADVTLADIARAVERRGASPQATARRLGLALGPDGGRQSADLAERAFAALAGPELKLPGPAPTRATLGLMAARSGD